MSTGRSMAALVAVVSLVALPACVSSDNGGAIGGSTAPGAASLGAKVPPAVRSRGTLRVGVAIGRPPFAVLDEGSAAPRGADIDLANRVAQLLGLTASFVVEDDPAMALSDLAGDKIDVAAAGTVDTSDARSGVRLVDYLSAPQGKVALATAAGSSSLAPAVAAALNVAVGDRSYDAILQRWGLSGQAVGDITIDGLHA